MQNIYSINAIGYVAYKFLVNLAKELLIYIHEPKQNK